MICPSGDASYSTHLDDELRVPAAIRLEPAALLAAAAAATEAKSSSISAEFLRVRCAVPPFGAVTNLVVRERKK